MKLWIDDEREPPDDTWTWAKSVQDAMDVLCKRVPVWKDSKIVDLRPEHDVELISFDHDLGPCQAPASFLDDGGFWRGRCPEGTTCIHDGTFIINLLEEYIHEDPRFPVPSFEVHSQNPVGRQRLVSAIESIERFVKEREGKET